MRYDLCMPSRGAPRRTPASGVDPGYVAPVGPSAPGPGGVAPREWNRIFAELAATEERELKALQRRLDKSSVTLTVGELRGLFLEVRARVREAVETRRNLEHIADRLSRWRSELAQRERTVTLHNAEFDRISDGLHDRDAGLEERERQIEDALRASTERRREVCRTGNRLNGREAELAKRQRSMDRSL